MNLETRAGMVHCAVDVGGTLAKCIVFVPGEDVLRVYKKSLELRLTKEGFAGTIWIDEGLSSFLNDNSGFRRSRKNESKSALFIKFLTSEMDALEQVLGELASSLPSGTSFFATGGGANKVRGFLRKYGMNLIKYDEMECLARGLRRLCGIPGECFKLKEINFHGAIGEERSRFESIPVCLQPKDGILVVSVGSGVSFVHCTDSTHERVGGSSLGGSTFLGLVALLTGEERFDGAIDLAANGDSATVDMLVKDIFGGEYHNEVQGLRSTTLASSFGKAISKERRKYIRKEDLALSCLMMISMNVAALAHLHAEAKKAKHILFTGNFIARNKSREEIRLGSMETKPYLNAASELHLHKGNTIAMRTLSYAVSFWSGESRTALFCKREGYLGCIGAMSSGLGKKIDRWIPLPTQPRL